MTVDKIYLEQHATCALSTQWEKQFNQYKYTLYQFYNLPVENFGTKFTT